MPLTKLGLIMLVGGILMLGVGLYFYAYQEGGLIWGWSYPYQTQGAFGIIIGFVLLVAGIIHMVRARPAVPPPP